MQAGYFVTAWQDIRNSPRWFSKLVVLSLVGLIPVFGWIVIYGYAFGWARDKAWDIHAPMPEHIFGNEDGKLYSRGFFAMVIGAVCMLLPWVIDLMGNAVSGIGLTGLGWHHMTGGFLAFPFALFSWFTGLVFFVASIAAYFFATLFYWVGTMRMSIYGRLSPGFQLGKIVLMIRHDFRGILRILGMVVLLSLITTAVVFALVLVVLLVGVLVAFVVTGGTMSMGVNQLTAGIAGVGLIVGLMLFVLALLTVFVSMVMTVLVQLMTARALGYWTRQFDIPSWRGQDDPMPFESASRS